MDFSFSDLNFNSVENLPGFEHFLHKFKMRGDDRLSVRFPFIILT